MCGVLYLEEDHETLKQCLPLLHDVAGMCKNVFVGDACRLLQAHQASAAMGVDRLLPSRLLNNCLQRVKQRRPSNASSLLHKECIGVLQSLDTIKHSSIQHPLLLGTSHVDALCTTDKGAQVVVKVIGPELCFANQPRVYDGPTQLEHALLRQQGHVLGLLHHLDWNACNDVAARRALLDKLVGNAVAGL